MVCEILAAAVTPPPESLRAAGVTHWLSRRLANWLRRVMGISVSHDSITVLWRKFCLQPHRAEGFKFSTGPGRHTVQLCRKAASLAATSARNMGCRSIDGEYLLAGTSRPSASAMART